MIISSIHAEGFTSVITQNIADRKKVAFQGDADIDADGTNGQKGKRAAYMVGDVGLEALANGGMGMRNGKVVGVASWFTDIVILGDDGQPRVFPGGVIASKTAYKARGMRSDDPAAYIDSVTYPYIVVPPVIRQRAQGIVLGCLCRATRISTGKSAFGGVCDIGPRNRVGELSIMMAELIGIPSSPRNGGIELDDVLYELWPDTPADGLELIAA